MEIEEAYCSKEVCELLREKGFDIEIPTHRDKYGRFGYGSPWNWNKSSLSCSCPTHQMACAWVRKKYNLYICPRLCTFWSGKKRDKEYHKWEDRVLNLTSGNQVHPQFAELHKYYDAYEEAVEAALMYTLTNLI